VCCVGSYKGARITNPRERGYPGQALSVYYNAKEAFDVTEKMFPNLNAHNDAADAFRHAYFNALNTRAMGHELAYQFGVAHEDWSGNWRPHSSDDSKSSDE